MMYIQDQGAELSHVPGKVFGYQGDMRVKVEKTFAARLTLLDPALNHRCYYPGPSTVHNKSSRSENDGN